MVTTQEIRSLLAPLVFSKHRHACGCCYDLCVSREGEGIARKCGEFRDDRDGPSVGLSGLCSALEMPTPAGSERVWIDLSWDMKPQRVSFPL